MALLGFLALCLLIGIADAVVTQGSVHDWYQTLHHPPGTPPNWLFGPVWTVLYGMIAVAGWRVWRKPGSGVALRWWGWQLLANAVWTPAFFGLHAPRLALLVIVTLVLLIGQTIRRFAATDRFAALLLLPYLGWTLYAAYLNAATCLLNPHS